MTERILMACGCVANAKEVMSDGSTKPAAPYTIAQRLPQTSQASRDGWHNAPAATRCHHRIACPSSSTINREPRIATTVAAGDGISTHRRNRIVE